MKGDPAYLVIPAAGLGTRMQAVDPVLPKLSENILKTGPSGKLYSLAPTRGLKRSERDVPLPSCTRKKPSENATRSDAPNISLAAVP
jgi:hypothetical protein